jgi:glycosyltransferase involved in cell wall biosynthesis
MAFFGLQPHWDENHRVKVLQICSARNIGGGERHVADLSRALHERGHGVFAAIASGSPLRSELSFLPQENVLEISFRNSLDYFSAVKIAKFAAANSVELIHAHIAKDYLITALTARIAGIPFVITRHVLFPMSRLHRMLLRGVRFVIAPSSAVSESLRRQPIFPANKIVTIRHGFDHARYTIRQDVKRDGLVVGSIGNLDAVKGFDVFIRAATLVTAKMPDVKFEIVGDDRSADGRNEKSLRKLISDLNLGRSVRLTGWSPDVLATLAGFDVFVSSSRSESFGMAIAEAMLSGVPVVASETEGAREIIAEPSVGVLVPIGSPDALADAIVGLLNDPSKRDALAESGSRSVRERFSLDRMIDETEAVYRRAISLTGSGSV